MIICVELYWTFIWVLKVISKIRVCRRRFFSEALIRDALKNQGLRTKLITLLIHEFDSKSCFLWLFFVWFVFPTDRDCQTHEWLFTCKLRYILELIQPQMNFISVWNNLIQLSVHFSLLFPKFLLLFLLLLLLLLLYIFKIKPERKVLKSWSTDLPTTMILAKEEARCGLYTHNILFAFFLFFFSLNLFKLLLFSWL